MSHFAYSTFNCRIYSGLLRNTQKYLEILKTEISLYVAKHDYRLVCADTPETNSSMETKLDVNLFLSSAIVLSLRMTFLWRCGGAAPAAS